MYKSLAHPQMNGYVRPTTLEERLMHVAEAKRTLGSTIPWIVDTMDNDLKHAMGDRPNSEFIIDPAGKIVRMRDWSSAEAIRKDLADLVGPVENPTSPTRLRSETNRSRTKVARGVVPRVEHPGGMMALKVTTHETDHPAYVKLRAESDSLRRGDGKLYLGFFVDPIHHVHWNNLSGPVQVEVSGQNHVGPKVSVDADADPREFVLDVRQKGPVEVTIRYVACDDKDTWCRKFTQKFTVQPEVDRDAGRPMSRRRPGR